MKLHSDGYKRHEAALLETDRQVDFNGAVLPQNIVMETEKRKYRN
jgi:hypothetical protein